MARIPDEELERLKSEVSLQRLVEARGIELRRHGADLLGLCPFHDDHEPSLVVTPAKNLWHCLGACQAGGSVIDWVMRAEGVSFRHAVELLRADLPLAAGPSPRVGTVRKLPAPVERDAGDAEALAQVVGYYHETLKQSPEALAYLQRRGLRSSEMVEHFRLGFANRTLGLRLPMANRKEGAEIRSRLQRLGVLRESGHEHFNGSLVIPIFDDQGRVVEMYGRKVTRGLRTGTPDHLYLPGPHRGVWNAEALEQPDVILTEALIDALTFWVHGYRNVTAAYGVEGFTDDHLAAFKEHGVRRVLIAYDRDEAGERAAVLLAVKLCAAGVDCYRVRFPQGQDANAYALEDLDSAQARLGQVLRKAVWLGKGKPPDGGPSPTPIATAKPEARATKEVVVDASLPLAAPSLASPEPPAPPPDPDVEAGENEVVMHFGDRRWRVRGMARNTSFDVLKVNVMVTADGGPFHVDTLDLYSARARAAFAKDAAAELAVEEATVKKDLGRLLMRLEALAEEQIRKAQEPATKEVELTSEEEAAALDLLRDPRLLERILTDFDRAGVVGEETNKLVGYLAATSRLLDRPLAVVIQSTSAAGKSALMDSVLSLMPDEQRVKFSAMTGQSLFYMGERDLQHRILALVEEEGAERASYALKLLQSEGEISIASTGKDPASGRLVTHEYRVTGPVAIFLTTTSVDVDEELLNRCVLLTVNEDREQTRAIHRRQREAETLDGLLAGEDREAVLRLHKNAQRLLRPVLVANPFAGQLRFSDERTRSRRDHTKYLCLIRTIALLHQHQRELLRTTHNGRVVAYIEVTRDDVRVANRLAHEVLGRSLDELPPGTRRLLMVLDEMVGAECDARGLDRTDHRFSRRDLRAFCGWSDTQLKVHLARLVDLEYLCLHRGGRGQGFVYELSWDGRGRDGTPFLPGLIDPAELTESTTTTADRSGSNGHRSGSGRPPVQLRSGVVQFNPENAYVDGPPKSVVRARTSSLVAPLAAAAEGS